MDSDAKEFTQKSTKLRSEGRLDEAILAARKAIALEQSSANAWWQLALAQKEKDGIFSALISFGKVVDLAPGFPDGWCEYALAHQKVERNDEAVALYESALEANVDHTRSLRLLGQLLKQRGRDGDTQRRLELLRKLGQLGELANSERFDLAFLLAAAGEDLEAARVYEAHTVETDSEPAFFNLAILYSRMGRNADALDAYRISQGKDPDDKRTAQRIANALAPLRALRQTVLARAQPYLQPDDWYKYYVNPFALLNVEDAPDLRGNVKGLQKARQAVFREIELEDGKVEWIPGLTLDKSAAMTIVDSLSDEAQWVAHVAVFGNQPLRDFLERGHLEYFLVAEDESADEVVLPHMVPKSTLEIIGPKFAAQYNAVLTKAIDQGDVDIVDCVLDGRRWVLPAHEERCFEGAKRALARKFELLESLVLLADKRTVPRTEVEKALTKGQLDALLVHLPAEFHEAHARVGRSLRELSVCLYNRERDAEQSKAILQLGKVCASKSPALAHQMAEDEKFLDEAIRKESAEEAHLEFRDATLDITKAGVSYGDKKMAPEEVVAVRWGQVRTSESPATLRFRIAFKARNGTAINVTWTVSNNLEAQKKHWGKAVDATFTYLIANVMTNFRRQLDDGQTLRIGTLDVVKNGVIFEVQGWFSNKRLPGVWRNLRSRLENGAVVVSDITNSKCSAVLDLESNDNAFLLHLMCTNKENS